MNDELGAWSTERVKVAFDRYIAENGRLPTAPEVDTCAYLPSSRQIQRRFGGLKELRKLLGYETTDFGSGLHRSNMALSNNQRSKEAEKELERQLSSIFGEPYVHSEKYYGEGRNRVDFVVYTKSTIFGIDVFTTETRQDLQKNVAIKIDKYIDFPKNSPLFFVVVSQNLTEDEVWSAADGMTKTDKLPNVRVVTVEGLFEAIKPYQRYENPIGFNSLYDL